MKTPNQTDAPLGTIECWQKYYPEDELSAFEAAAIKQGVSDFITLLAEWEATDLQRRAQGVQTRRKLARLQSKVRREATASMSVGAP